MPLILSSPRPIAPRARMILAAVTVACLLQSAPLMSSARAGIIVGGNASAGIATALDAMGKTYTWLPSGTYPAATGTDTLIISEDGGTVPPDYTAWLAGGGDLIVCGGAGDANWVNWTSNYLNVTDSATWHQNNSYVNVGTNRANNLMPATYAFADAGCSYHMMGFTATTNTTLYGRNAEPTFIGAFREYTNGGSFNYLSLDVGNHGTFTDRTNFIIPWLGGAFDAAANGINLPEPTAFAAAAIAATTIALRRHRRRNVA